MAMAEGTTTTPGTAFIVALVALLLCLVAPKSSAFQFSVGGGNGWTINPNSNFSEWAHRTRFQIGDSLLFTYQTNQDAVLYVNQDSYNNCNTDNYIAKYDDGHTVFTFNQSGPFHFISGNKEHCLKNQKLVVVVLADRSSNKTSSSPPPPPPPPSAAPSPAPAGESSPSPPPEVASAPATEETPPPSPTKSSAASLLVGFAASVLPSYAILLL